MSKKHEIDRKQFLTFALMTASGAMLGCTASDSPGGAGGSGGSGSGGSGGAGGGIAGTGGSGGGSGGSAGSGGSGGSAGSGGSGGADGGQAGADGGRDTPVEAPPVAANCGTNLKVIITGNHDHVLTITMAEVTAAVTKVYNVRGTSNHPHRIQITAQEFRDLGAGKALRKMSCDDGHEHEYLINCVGAEDLPNSNAPEVCLTNRTCGNSDTGNFCPNSPAPP